MKSIKSIFTTLLCLVGVSSAMAQENTLLWSISGNGLKHTSYVYGTIHMMCEDDFSVRPKVTAAFEKCDQLFLEIDMDDPKEMEAMTAAAYGEQKLSEILTAVQQEKLDQKLQEELGMPLSAVDSYSLTTIASLFMMKNMECQTIKSYEQEFIEMATARSMKIEGLEDVAFQLECLSNSANTTKIFEDLFTEEMETILDSMVVLYQGENMQGFNELFSQENYMDENAREWLLKKRNANWVAKMPKIIKKKPTFFAVGAAHLLNEYGVIEGLRAEGYTVTPIFK